jgi:transposase InsO family protein
MFSAMRGDLPIARHVTVQAPAAVGREIAMQHSDRFRTWIYTRAEAKHAIGRYIDGFYNPVRRHSALDFSSPAQFERLAVN